MTIELRHLRYVAAAAEHGSFRRAAHALGVQVSAVSRRIADLEDEVGAALFQRGSGGVTPTDAGHRFIQRARTALAQVSEAEVEAGTVGRGADGVVRIGLFVALTSRVIANVLHDFGEAHPRVRIDFVEGEQAEHVEAVRHSRLDLAFVAGEVSDTDCDSLRIADERVYIAMPSHDPLTHKREVEWSDIAHREILIGTARTGPEIFRCLLVHLGRAGYAPRVRQQAVQRDTLLQLVAAGDGLTLISESATAFQVHGVVYRPIAGATVPISAIWSSKNGNPPFRRLLSLAKQCVARGSQQSSGHPPALAATRIPVPKNYESVPAADGSPQAGRESLSPRNPT